jgi:hypothetical protein
MNLLLAASTLRTDSRRRANAGENKEQRIPAPAESK